MSATASRCWQCGQPVDAGVESTPDNSGDVEEDNTPYGSTPLYATFARRLNALSIDTVILIGLSTFLFVLVYIVERIDVVRIGLILVWWLALLFYEPLMVWRLGATVGHYKMNLHVVDNRTERKISFLKAMFRFWFKVLLGVFSFLSMNFSRRHQAVHDILTNSSVRIRDAEKARPYHYTLGTRGGA